MRFKRKLLASVAIAIAMSLVSPATDARASTDEEIAELKRIILEQQRRFEEQDRRLRAQERKLGDQEKRIEAQKSKLAEQEKTLAKQQRLTRQQGLILTLQDQDIYELRDRVEDRTWPTGSTTFGDNGRGPASEYAVFGRRPGATGPIVAPRAPGLVLSGATSPQAPQPIPPSDPGPVPPSGDPGPVPPTTGDQKPPPGPGDTARPESEKTPDQLLVEAGGILLPPGTLQIEPSVEYSHFSSNRFQVSGLSLFDAIIIGFIRADDLDRDVVTSALTTRVGLFRRAQMDVRVPGVYREDKETLAVGTPDVRDRSSSTLGLGDISAGVSYQPIIGRGSIPNVIIRVDATFPTGEHPFEIPTELAGAGGETRLARPPTGNGFYAVGTTATMVWTSDPVVFFAGGGYTFNLPRTFDRFGEIDPGDAFRFFGGMNVALSESVSLNLSFTDQISGTTTQNDIESPNTTTNDARVVLGTSIGISSGTSLLVSAGIGLTEESPDFTFTVSLPLTFRSLF